MALEKVTPLSLTSERLEELSSLQRSRVLAFVQKEREKKSLGHTDHHLAKTINETVKEYRHTLLELQRIRFELGLDDYKGPQHVVRGASQTTTFPDGSSVQKQVFEAVNTLEAIFDKRQIPRRE